MPPRTHSPAEKRAAFAEKQARSVIVPMKKQIAKKESKSEDYVPLSLPNYVVRMPDGSLKLMGKVVSADHVRPHPISGYLFAVLT
jgi:hypothetical protein